MRSLRRSIFAVRVARLSPNCLLHGLIRIISRAKENELRVCSEGEANRSRANANKKAENGKSLRAGKIYGELFGARKSFPVNPHLAVVPIDRSDG